MRASCVASVTSCVPRGQGGTHAILLPPPLQQVYGFLAAGMQRWRGDIHEQRRPGHTACGPQPHTDTHKWGCVHPEGGLQRALPTHSPTPPCALETGMGYALYRASSCCARVGVTTRGITQAHPLKPQRKTPAAPPPQRQRQGQCGYPYARAAPTTPLSPLHMHATYEHLSEETHSATAGHVPVTS